eukprot:snap_masked-scaffold_2-processed-gene-6.8-mRNA-1 protein AED:1.00 eAED:1.00 QI:0/-1/0/0/-1/1/1/0/386
MALVRNLDQDTTTTLKCVKLIWGEHMYSILRYLNTTSTKTIYFILPEVLILDFKPSVVKEVLNITTEFSMFSYIIGLRFDGFRCQQSLVAIEEVMFLIKTQVPNVCISLVFRTQEFVLNWNKNKTSALQVSQKVQKFSNYIDVIDLDILQEALDDTTDVHSVVSNIVQQANRTMNSFPNEFQFSLSGVGWPSNFSVGQLPALNIMLREFTLFKFRYLFLFELFDQDRREGHVYLHDMGFYLANGTLKSGLVDFVPVAENSNPAKISSSSSKKIGFSVLIVSVVAGTLYVANKVKNKRKLSTRKKSSLFSPRSRRLSDPNADISSSVYLPYRYSFNPKFQRNKSNVSSLSIVSSPDVPHATHNTPGPSFMQHETLRPYVPSGFLPKF